MSNYNTHLHKWLKEQLSALTGYAYACVLDLDEQHIRRVILLLLVILSTLSPHTTVSVAVILCIIRIT